jgi:hypothetical protein
VRSGSGGVDLALRRARAGAGDRRGGLCAALAVLSEQIKSDGEVCRREFADEFAQLQASVDRMQIIVENMARLEAARAAPVDGAKMN